LTDDLRKRLEKHNAGDVSHTAKFRPWRIQTAIAFTDRDRASQFERYLKTGSGRAFAKKRL
jgi:predicted GIY-YIG superfamily endonuclease